MSNLIKLIIFAIASMVGLWMVFQGIAHQNGLMIMGALLTFFASLLLLWSQTKNNN
jgi:hypothetical protein